MKNQKDRLLPYIYFKFIYLQNKFTIKLSSTLPKPKIVWEVENQKKDIQNIVTEWEKNKIKTLFKRLDVGNLISIKI